MIEWEDLKDWRGMTGKRRIKFGRKGVETSHLSRENLDQRSHGINQDATQTMKKTKTIKWLSGDREKRVN